MLSWDALNFILVIYLSATQLTYSLIELLAMARRVIWIRSVRPSVQKFSWNWLFSFSRELNMVLGAHVVLRMTEPDFLKKMFYPRNGDNRPGPGFFECIGKFRFFSQFFICFINLVYNGSVYHCNSCVLKQNSGSWNMVQNALGQSDCGIFQSIAGF